MNTYKRVLRVSPLTVGMLAVVRACIRVGAYAIHIIVKNGRTMLLGIVDSAADRQVAEVRARQVTGVFEVENGLTVARQGRSAR